MKKKFFIIPIILIIVIIGLVSCKNCVKTKAYSYTLSKPFQQDTYTLPPQGGFALIFDSNLSSTSSFPLCIYVGSNLRYLVEFHPSSGSMSYILYGPNNYTASTPITSDSGLYYLQLAFDYTADEIYLTCAPIYFTLTNRQDDSPYISNVSLGEYVTKYLPDTVFVNDYLSSQPTVNIKLSYSAYPNDNLRGLEQLYLFDILGQFSNDIDEQVEFMFDDLKADISTKYYNYFINLEYYNGYTAGYQYGFNIGYSNGYTAGDTAGYNDGYTAGYDDGLADNAAAQTVAYNHGYSDGAQDGYRDGLAAGEVAGYNSGYTAGYDVGWADGQTGGLQGGFTVISAIFTAIGSILAVELLPGVPLGLFFLVPLFFALVGLILWIWRRN